MALPTAAPPERMFRDLTPEERERFLSDTLFELESDEKMSGHSAVRVSVFFGWAGALLILSFKALAPELKGARTLLSLELIVASFGLIAALIGYYLAEFLLRGERQYLCQVARTKLTAESQLRAAGSASAAAAELVKTLEVTLGEPRKLRVSESLEEPKSTRTEGPR